LILAFIYGREIQKPVQANVSTPLMSSSSAMLSAAGLDAFSGSFTDSSYRLTPLKKKRTEIHGQPDLLGVVHQEVLLLIAPPHYYGFMSIGFPFTMQGSSG